MISNRAMITYLVALIAFIAFVFPSCEPTENSSTLSSVLLSPTQSLLDAQDYQKYVSNQYGFSVQYPSGWIAKEGYLGGVVTFWGPRLPDNYTTSMSIFARNLANYKLYNVDDFINWNKLLINNTMKNVNLLDERQIQIDGVPATVLTFTASTFSGNTEFKLRDNLVLFAKEGIGYSIILDVPDAYNEDYISYFNQAASSFKFNIPKEISINPKSYFNSKFGFSLQYPDDWDIMEDYRGCPVVLVGPKLSNDWAPVIAVEIMSPANKEEPFTLDDFLKLEKLQASRILIDFQILDEHSAVIGSQSAVITTFTGKVISNNTEVKLKDVGASFVKDGIGYSITLDCIEALTADNIQYFDLVTSSFKFNTE